MQLPFAISCRFLAAMVLSIISLCGAGSTALRPYYIAPECISRASLTVFANNGDTSIICIDASTCFIGEGPVDPLDPNASIGAEYWTKFSPPKIADLFTSDQMTVTGEDGALYSVVDEGLYVSVDNGTSFTPYLLWDCGAAAAGIQCPIINPAYNPPIKPRPEGKVLQCSPNAVSTLNITDQTSNALYMTWESQETSSDSLYFLECDPSSNYDSGTAQVSSIGATSPPNYRGGQFMTVSSLGLLSASTVANSRDDYFVWWKTSAGDTGPISGAAKTLVVNISSINTAGDVCSAIVKALINSGISANATGATAPGNVVRATCDGPGAADLNIEQLTSGAVPSERRLHRGTLTKSTASASTVNGFGSVGGTGPEYATLTITGTGVTKGAASGGADFTNDSPAGAPSSGNWYIGNAKTKAWEYFYFYNNGGCADAKAVASAKATVHRVDVSGLTTKSGIVNAITNAANSIDGFTTNVTVSPDIPQSFAITASARSRLLDGSQFFLVDQAGKLWTWFFDKSGSRTSPLTNPTNPSGTFTRIDISSANESTTANEIAVKIRDSINAAAGMSFNATITTPFKTPVVSVTLNALTSPAIRSKVTITMLPTAALDSSVGGLIPLTSLDGSLFRICLESDGNADSTSFIGWCKRNVTAAGATIELVLVFNATKEQNALALTNVLNNATNYPGSVAPFIAERGVGANSDKVYVWQRDSGAVPTRGVATISTDNAGATPDGMSLAIVSQDGSFVSQLCYERTAGKCSASQIKVTRDDSYISVRRITSGVDPVVTVDGGHGFVDDDLVAFIETNDSGGSSKLAQRAFRVTSKFANQFKIISDTTVTTTSAGTFGRAYKAGTASTRVSDATADTNVDGTFTKSSHGLSNDDVLFFTGEASSTANFAGGKLCLVASVASSAGTFKCGGKRNTASETGIAYYKVADDSTKIAVSSVSVGANPTITTSAQHRLEVGDILVFPFPRNAMSQLVDGGIWQHKFFRVASVPTATSLTVSPSVTTTTTAAGYIYRSIVESKTHVVHGFKRIMDAHPVFPLHFETYISDPGSVSQLRAIQKKNGTVPSLYQHKITDQTVANGPSGMRFVMFDIANNNRKIEVCIEHTIMGPGGQCQPSTDPNNAVVEIQVFIQVVGVTSGANPTVTLRNAAHAVANEDLVVFLAVDGGATALNQRGFKVTGQNDVNFNLLPQVTTTGGATKGFAYELNSSKKIAASATANSDTMFTGPPDPSSITGNDDVIYLPGSQSVGTSFANGVICVVGSYNAQGSGADTWNCNRPRAASGTNTGIDYFLISSANQKKTVTSISSGNSPVLTFSAAHSLRPGQLVIVEVTAGLSDGEAALFRNKFFRVVTVPLATTLTLDPPLSSTLNTAGGSGFLWAVATKEPPTQTVVNNFFSIAANASNYPGGVSPFYVGSMTSKYNFFQQKVTGTPVGRPFFSVTTDTVANTVDGGIFNFYLADDSAVSVCFSKASGCPAPSARVVVVDLTGATSGNDVASRFARAIHDAAIPGIDDVTAVTSTVTIYLLPGPFPTKKPELFGNSSGTALCGAWSVTAVTTSYASMIGTYSIGGFYTAPVSWNIDALANPTYVHTDGSSPAWAVAFGDDSSTTFLSSATKSSTTVSQGAIDPGDVMVTASTAAYAVGNPIVTIANTVSLDLVPDPTKGVTFSSITFAGFTGYAQDKQKITLPAKSSILHGQAITFWSIIGGLKKYAVQFSTLPAGTYTLLPERNEVSVDVSDGPTTAVFANRLAAALDPLPGISASIGQQQVLITCDKAANTTHALNFNLFGAANNQQFVVWMDKGGATFTPPSGSIGVRVVLGDAVSATDVANKLLAAATSNNALTSAFRIVRKGTNGVRFVQIVGGEVAGRGRIVLGVDRADYDGNTGIGSNTIRLFSLTTEYILCVKQLAADCSIPESPTRVNIDCTNGPLCNSTGKVAPLIQAAIANGFGGAFSSAIVGTSLFITVNATGISKPSYIDWTYGSWQLTNLVDAGQMPRSMFGAESDGGNSNKDGIFVGSGESSYGWRYTQIRKGSANVYIEQDVPQANVNEVLTSGNTESDLFSSFSAALYAGTPGFRLFGDGVSGRNAVTAPYATEGRSVAPMYGVLEGFDVSLASTSISCRLWALSVNMSTAVGYGKPCNIGGSVTGMLRAADNATSAPLKMYPPKVTFVKYDQAIVTWKEPESKGNTASGFSAATTEVQFMRCDEGIGGCNGPITCPGNVCPTNTATQGSSGITLNGIRGDEAYYVVRVRTKHAGGVWGELSDPVYARDEPCPAATTLY